MSIATHERPAPEAGPSQSVPMDSRRYNGDRGPRRGHRLPHRIPVTAPAVDSGVYVTTVSVDEVFVDHTYQRELDKPRARTLAAAWDRRLAGIIEVSDRGEDSYPRYAVIDGQHRWAAAQLVDPPPILVANVHDGLAIADEAALFDKLNRERRRITTWDHWHARKAAGDKTVLAIEAAVARTGLRIHNQPSAGNVRCTTTLEKIHAFGGARLIEHTLRIIVDVWGYRLDGFDAPLVHGLALVLHHLAEPLDEARLIEALLDVPPRQVKTQALALRDITTGTQPVLVAIAVMGLYNRRPGRKLLVSNRTFNGGSRNAHSIRRDETQAAHGAAGGVVSDAAAKAVTR